MFVRFQCFNMSLQSKEILSFHITCFSIASPFDFHSEKNFYPGVVFAWHLLFRMVSGKVFASLRCYVPRTLKHLDTSSLFISLPLVCIVIHLFYFITRDVSRLLCFFLQLSIPIITGTLFSDTFYFLYHSYSSQYGRRDCSNRCSALVVKIPSIHACCSLEYRHSSGKWELLLWAIRQMQRCCGYARSFNFFFVQRIVMFLDGSFIALCLIHHVFVFHQQWHVFSEDL